MVEDAKTAVRFLRANAEKLGIDPNHIAVMGESAGGYLAAMVGTTSGHKEFKPWRVFKSKQRCAGGG